MITPSSNTVVERVVVQMTCGMLDAVSVHFTRIAVKEISLHEESLRQFDLETLCAAARLLADAQVDVIAWNGTSGAWKGPAADRELCAAIERECGVVATTSTLAQIDAFRELGIRRYALAVPYLDEIRREIVATYAAAGFTCVGGYNLGISTNTAFAEVPLGTVRALIRRSNSPAAEGIAVICTNFPSAWVVAEMEQELGKPILDSTVITLWHALRRVGVRRPISGWGQLLEQAPDGGR